MVIQLKVYEVISEHLQDCSTEEPAFPSLVSAARGSNKKTGATNGEGRPELEKIRTAGGRARVRQADGAKEKKKERFLKDLPPTA